MRDGRVAEGANGELGYVVARHVEIAENGALHSRQSSEAIEAEVQHLCDSYDKSATHHISGSLICNKARGPASIYVDGPKGGP